MSRNGARCVSGSMDGTFKIWKCDAAEECLTLRGTVHSKNIIVLSRFFTSTLWYWNFMYFLSPVYTLFTLLVPAVDKSRTSVIKVDDEPTDSQHIVPKSLISSSRNKLLTKLIKTSS